MVIPGQNGGECLYCIFKMRADKCFVQGEENTRGLGREGSLYGKKAFHGLFGRTGNVIVDTKSNSQEKPQITDSADCLNGLCVG